MNIWNRLINGVRSSPNRAVAVLDQDNAPSDSDSFRRGDAWDESGVLTRTRSGHGFAVLGQKKGFSFAPADCPRALSRLHERNKLST